MSAPLDLTEWAGDLLRLLGLPVTVENLVAIVAWERAEGGHVNNRATWNPLNTSLVRPGAVSINSHGVKAYPNRQAGLAANAATIRLSYYAGIVASLRAGANASATAAAVGASRWGTSAALIAGTVGGARAIVRAWLQTHALTSTGTPAAAAGAGGELTGAIMKRRPTVSLVSERVTSLVIGGTGTTATDVSEAIRSAQLSFTTDQVPQLSLAVADPTLRLLDRRIFAARQGARWRGQQWEVAACEVSGADGGSLAVDLRARGCQVLRRWRGPLLIPNVSPTEFAYLAAVRANLGLVAEPSARRAGIGIATGGADGGEAESAWSVLERLGTELGYYVFVAGETLYFGRPTWLIAHLPTRRVVWHHKNPDANEPGLLAMPTCRRTEDGGKAATISLQFHPDVGSKILPGQSIALEGIPSFTGRYLVTSTSGPLHRDSAWSVEAATPDDPDPQPPDDSRGTEATSSGSSSTPTGARGSWIWPVQGRVGSGFGPRKAPLPGASTFHKGIDIGAPTGTPIKAAAAGQVVQVVSSSSAGLMTVIDHGGGITSRYLHQSRQVARTGDHIGQGGLVGYVGSTGNSTGPHLHFEIRVGGEARDPLGYLPRL